jgi:hypothetical protein
MDSFGIQEEEERFMTVHNHGPEEGAGLACNESRLPDGSLQGVCLMPKEPDYRRFIKPTKCSKEECQKSYIRDHWGTKQANREGWFLQRNGDAWCPDHNPDWVAEWRAKRAEKK